MPAVAMQECSRISLCSRLDAIRDSRIGCLHGVWNASWSRSASEIGTRCVPKAIARLARAEKSFANRSGFEITDLETNTARVGASSSGATRLRANRDRKSDWRVARLAGFGVRNELYVTHVYHAWFHVVIGASPGGGTQTPSQVRSISAAIESLRDSKKKRREGACALPKLRERN